MYKFGRRSLQELSTCSGFLQRVLQKALNYGLVDFSVVQGHRGEEEQNRYFEMGLSKVKWPNGKHNKSPSEAVDCYPYDHHFGCSLVGSKEQIQQLSIKHNMSKADVNAYITMQYHKMAMVILAAAKEIGGELRWGGDWDRDNDTLDQKFNDLCHFEEV